MIWMRWPRHGYLLTPCRSALATLEHLQDVNALPWRFRHPLPTNSPALRASLDGVENVPSVRE